MKIEIYGVFYRRRQLLSLNKFTPPMDITLQASEVEEPEINLDNLDNEEEEVTSLQQDEDRYRQWMMDHNGPCGMGL